MKSHVASNNVAIQLVRNEVMEKYFVISTGEDGVAIMCMGKEELETKLKDEDWGEVTIMDDMPENGDLSYCSDSLIIIKGEIITPRAVDVVKKWEV